MLIDLLPDYLSYKEPPVYQDENRATYTPQIQKNDGLINWGEPAVIIERKIRAYANWPKSTTMLFDKPVIVTKARIAQSEYDGKLVRKCQDGWIEILELIAPSGKTMSGTSFMLGHNKAA